MPRKPKVSNLHHDLLDGRGPQPGVKGQQEVLRLQVTMDDVQSAQGLQPVGWAGQEEMVGQGGWAGKEGWMGLGMELMQSTTAYVYGDS